MINFFPSPIPELADRKKEVFTQKNKIDGELNINLVNLIR